MSDLPDVLFDYDEIGRVAETMGIKLGEISDELGELETTVSGLLQNGLVFEKASPALTEAYNAFSEQMKKSASTIQEYANTFTELAKAMEESDLDITAEVERARQEAGGSEE
ncbi:hypothetical protein [Streptomyces sp. YIM 98790]|uniref:hypothetical protein n=1 Tax=Streptomyces sp. YIM 98790 TaxID=2689077 RepID=UPI0028BE57D7|nr:hypothetical protein [Streptomyces sp. YIM 98790]